MTKKSDWRRLQRANLVQRLTESDIDDAMRNAGDTDRATVKAMLEQEVYGIEYWINDIYQVAKRPLPNADGKVGAYHLNIRRRDGRVILRDWRHFQEIKNQLVGEECEGLEIYPAESRLNDTSNKYHLWVFTDPTYRIPFGMQQRDVIKDDGGTPVAGYRQRRIK